ncbi:hypothetical protein HFP89_01380 [Wenzhouxiangella sp. XN79A]|uniref:hypothetical protein n=1 Tax=Wenzhouxiangella sp. XN79A TaxID=2724193 RepID=UPI00144AB384|nr:hypothetical protein [Wenzhouxiangella sp. XN79A]NKI33815.1 hypothetical protein [Wenzhouxiangella sp. XN79A]
MRRKHLIATLFFSALVVTALAWWNRNAFSEVLPWDPALAEPPRQVAVERPAFMARANDVDYRVQPLYAYELTGLVVSFKRFRPGIGLHERWNDYINVADVCVVWGPNATDLDLNRFKFWNLEFTCNFKTNDRDAWAAFDQNALSNNHLLTTDPRIQAVIDDLRVGDIVHLRGYLSEYGQPGGYIRGTSTTRTDRGNGACETLHLEHAQILASMDSDWRRLFWLGLLGLVFSVAWWFLTPHHHLR